MHDDPRIGRSESVVRLIEEVEGVVISTCELICKSRREALLRKSMGYCTSAKAGQRLAV